MESSGVASDVDDQPPRLLQAFIRRMRAIGSEPDPLPGPELPASRLIGSALKARLDDAIAHAALVRTRDDPEDVHRARSTVRKLRAILRGFRPFLERAWADRLREELRWFAEQLGAVRDIDVALTALRSRAESVPEPDARYVADVLRPLRDARLPARERLLATMESERYVRLLRDLEDATVSPVLAEAAKELGAVEMARIVLRKTSKSVRKALKRARAGVETHELHHARIVVRNGRYAAEACEPVCGKRARRLAERLSRLQDALGAINDAAFIQQRLRETIEDAGAHLVAGQLIALEAVEGRTARGNWKAVRRKALRDDWTGLE